VALNLFMPRPSRQNPNQSAFDWAAAALPSSPDSSPAKEPFPIPSPEEVSPAPALLVLPWDFRASFPEPLWAALEAGTLHQTDAEPDNVKAIHDEHVREGLMLLSDLDACFEARRTGTDPRTGKSPKTAKQSEALQKLYQGEIHRLERALADHMAAYADAFGRPAATAFEEAIRTWHAGGLVTSEQCPIVSPLPEAVERAAFGHEEDGTIVTPDEEEVREITESLAEKLCDLGVPEMRKPLVDKFAGDFGRDAAQNLEQWADEKVLAEEQTYSYGPGEPWHYYENGDGAIPCPADQIPPAAHPGNLLPDRLSQNPAKRRARIVQILADQPVGVSANIRTDFDSANSPTN
jgi:hypothetical protein